MSIETYRVVCEKGHDRIELIGADALAHAEKCTGRKLGTVPAGYGKATRRRTHVSWSPLNGKPWPWKAPRQAPLSSAVLDAMRTGDVVLESSDDYVTVDEIGEGDTFKLAGRIYTILTADAATVTVKMHKGRAGHEPERVSPIPRDRFREQVEKITASAGPVLLVKRGKAA